MRLFFVNTFMPQPAGQPPQVVLRMASKLRTVSCFFLNIIPVPTPSGTMKRVCYLQSAIFCVSSALDIVERDPIGKAQIPSLQPTFVLRYWSRSEQFHPSAPGLFTAPSPTSCCNSHAKHEAALQVRRAIVMC
jgi:hypothetical protein